MEENDRLIGKIEKLVEIFGNSFDDGLKNLTDQPNTNPQNVNVGNARLYLLSRRSYRRKYEQPPESYLKKTIHIGLDFSKNRAIDRSLSDIDYAPSTEGSTKDSFVIQSVDSESQNKPAISRKNSQITEPASLDQIQRNKAQLKRELRELDNEINKMQV
jgi:hypothetical protein